MEGSAAASTSEVVVYWRPGCYFCHRLLRDLDQARVQVELRNIWEDPDAAAFVRSVARGYETVPTVTVDGIPFVNPSLAEVLGT